MKKLLLSISFLFVALSFIGQSLEFLNAEEQVWAVPGTPEAAELSAHMDVKNISDQEITITVYRQLVDVIEGTTNQFCWGGICYSNSTDTSIFDETLAPQEVIVSNGTDGFTGYYEYHDNEGLSTIRYCFEDVSNPDNKSCIDIDYCVGDNCETLLGVENPDAQRFEISAISPNPVRGLSSIQYEFNTSGKASIVVYNMVGAEVKSIELDSKKGILLFNADDFQNGVYFYSLVYNGEVVQTKRMVVSK